MASGCRQSTTAVTPVHHWWTTRRIEISPFTVL
jgi:hypothetical protein